MLFRSLREKNSQRVEIIRADLFRIKCRLDNNEPITDLDMRNLEESITLLGAINESMICIQFNEQVRSVDPRNR